MACSRFCFSCSSTSSHVIQFPEGRSYDRNNTSFNSLIYNYGLTYMVRNKFDQDIFLASLLNRLIELEADRVVAEMRKQKPRNPIAKFFRIR